MHLNELKEKDTKECLKINKTENVQESSQILLQKQLDLIEDMPDTFRLEQEMIEFEPIWFEEDDPSSYDYQSSSYVSLRNKTSKNVSKRILSEDAEIGEISLHQFKSIGTNMKQHLK